MFLEESVVVLSEGHGSSMKRMWKLDESLDLERGTLLNCEGEDLLGTGKHGVVYSCKQNIREEDNSQGINVVVKCKRTECSSKDVYETGKWWRIPRHDNLIQCYAGKALNPGESKHFGALYVLEIVDCNLEKWFSKVKPLLRVLQMGCGQYPSSDCT